MYNRVGTGRNNTWRETAPDELGGRTPLIQLTCTFGPGAKGRVRFRRSKHRQGAGGGGRRGAEVSETEGRSEFTRPPHTHTYTNPRAPHPSPQHPPKAGPAHNTPPRDTRPERKQAKPKRAKTGRADSQRARAGPAGACLRGWPVSRAPAAACALSGGPLRRAAGPLANSQESIFYWQANEF